MRFSKVLFLNLVAVVGLASGESAQGTAIIEGRVLRAGTREPIPNAQITLLKSPPGGTTLTPETAAALDSIQQLVSGAPRGISRAYLDSLVSAREQALGLAPGTFAETSQTSVLTDVAGHFSFKDVAPGIYAIRASIDGYFGLPMNGAASPTVTRSVTVEAQKPALPTEIFMNKGGVITGRVRDPEGHPVSGINVAAMRLSYSNGRPQWTATVSRTTDDQGEFRIFWVSPGEYYVGVTPPVTQGSWVRTFFPGVMDPTAASVLAVQDGAEIPGIDFSIQTNASTPTFKISGRAINPLAVSNPTTGVVDQNVNTFILSPRDPGMMLDAVNPPTVQNSLPPAARPNGEFEIRNVRPGSYDLFAYAMPPAPVPAAGAASEPPFRRYYIDRARVDIRNSDVDGITLQIRKRTEISGKVVLQGTSPVPLDKIRISLRSLDAMPDAFAIIAGNIPVDASGKFSAPDIASAQYAIQLSGLPETAYVADVRQGPISVFSTGFTAGNQLPIPLEIVVNANGGTIEGNVQSSDRKPAPGAMVVLVPPASDRRNAMKFKTAMTDDKGSFSMNGIAPGEYTLFAWESVLPTAWMNSDFLAKYENRGTRILTSQGTRLNVRLALIPSDASRR